MWRKFIIHFLIVSVAPLAFVVCSPSGDEPQQVALPVVSDVTGITSCTNDLGWNIEVSKFEVSFKNLEFTVEGDTHAVLLQQISDFIVPQAMAHPGHLAGGEVTGELEGSFVVDFAAEASVSLGTGIFLEGQYNGMNLYFAKAAAGVNGSMDDPVVGHTAYIEGIARKDDAQIPFQITIDVENDLQMIGGVMDLTVTEDTQSTVGILLVTVDPFENDTIFDGVDFGSLELNTQGVALILPGQDAHNLLMKDLISHDQWMVITN